VRCAREAYESMFRVGRRRRREQKKNHKTKKRTSRAVAQSGKDANFGKGEQNGLRSFGRVLIRETESSSYLREVGDPQHEADGVQDVTLAGAVQTGDGVEQGVERGHDRALRVRLEPIDAHLLDVHGFFCREEVPSRSAPSARLREREGRVRPVRVRAARGAATRSGDACLVPRGDVLRARPCEEHARSSHDSTPPSYGNVFIPRVENVRGSNGSISILPRRATILTFVVRAFPPCHRSFPATPRGARWVCPDVVRDARDAAGGGDARA